MQEPTPLALAQRALRVRIRPVCHQRPPGGETLGPTVARSCERQCTVFVNLGAMLEIAAKVRDPSRAPYERAVRDLICQNCQSSPSAGDHCGDRATRNCPLPRYAGDVVETLKALRQRAARVPVAGSGLLPLVTKRGHGALVCH